MKVHSLTLNKLPLLLTQVACVTALCDVPVPLSGWGQSGIRTHIRMSVALGHNPPTQTGQCMHTAQLLHRNSQEDDLEGCRA